MLQQIDKWKPFLQSKTCALNLAESISYDSEVITYQAVIIHSKTMANRAIFVKVTDAKINNLYSLSSVVNFVCSLCNFWCSLGHFSKTSADVCIVRELKQTSVNGAPLLKNLIVPWLYFTASLFAISLYPVVVQVFIIHVCSSTCKTNTFSDYLIHNFVLGCVQKFKHGFKRSSLSFVQRISTYKKSNRLVQYY